MSKDRFSTSKLEKLHVDGIRAWVAVGNRMDPFRITHPLFGGKKRSENASVARFGALHYKAGGPLLTAELIEESGGRVRVNWFTICYYSLGSSTSKGSPGPANKQGMYDVVRYNDTEEVLASDLAFPNPVWERRDVMDPNDTYLTKTGHRKHLCDSFDRSSKQKSMGLSTQML